MPNDFVNSSGPKPPLAPYVHQEYPKFVFRAKADPTNKEPDEMVVKNRREEDQAIAEGWKPAEVPPSLVARIAGQGQTLVGKCAGCLKLEDEIKVQIESFNRSYEARLAELDATKQELETLQSDHVLLKSANAKMANQIKQLKKELPKPVLPEPEPDAVELGAAARAAGPEEKY